jgi:hypothetical protein
MGSIVIKNILNFLLWKKEEIFSFLDYVLFLVMIYFCYLGLKYAPQIEQLIIELKGGVI